SFELPALDGGMVRLDDFRGRPVVINFWAAWCPPCLEEMPAHDEFYRRYGDRIVYLAVNQRETVARIQRHLDEVKEAGQIGRAACRDRAWRRDDAEGSARRQHGRERPHGTAP